MKTLENQFTMYCSSSNYCETSFELLTNLYSQVHRSYHNLEHIKFLLTLFEEFENLIEDKTSVFFAIWFHDAVYDPQAKDNEKRSAKLAVKSLSKISLSADKIPKVEKIILATEKHSPDGLDADGKLFLDFDLGILGAETEVYDRYAKAIHKEYSFVSGKDYKIGRTNILQNFLRRDFIYFTDVMRVKFETNARRNVEREILEL